MSEPLIKVVRNDEGREFTIEVHQNQDQFGLKAGPSVRVYDRSFIGERFGEFGQFTGGSAYMFDLVESHSGGSAGWVLDGGVPVWFLSADNMNELVPWFRSQFTSPSFDQIKAWHDRNWARLLEGLSNRE